LERKGEDEGEVWRITSLRFDNPTNAVREHGAEGDKAKPLGVGALAALPFLKSHYRWDCGF
jgi:hypothetical protein